MLDHTSSLKSSSPFLIRSYKESSSFDLNGAEPLNLSVTKKESLEQHGNLYKRKTWALERDMKSYIHVQEN